MIVPDSETSVDLICFEPIATSIVELIKGVGTDPITIGVHGDWGAGKSSILLMVEKELKENPQIAVVHFNGWLFQGFENTKTIIIETIVEQLAKKESLPEKTISKFKDLFYKINFLKMSTIVANQLVSQYFGHPPGSFIDTMTFENIVKESDNNDSNSINSSTQSVEFDTAKKSYNIQDFRYDFEKLLKESEIERLVVIVDDLDRCLPTTAIETLEAIRLFLFVKKAAFVIGADEAMIEYAVKKYFPDLPDSATHNSYAKNYLEKLIQVPFHLPSLGYMETRTYLILLLANQSKCLNTTNLDKLNKLGQEVLRAPWKKSELTRAMILKEIGSIPTELDEHLKLAHQVSMLLTEGTHGNPRQIKRFLNTLNLRLAIANSRGISDDLDPKILAKLMLAEYFRPTFFKDISDEVKVNKVSSIVKKLEQRTIKGPVNSTKRKKKAEVQDNKLVKELKNNMEDKWKERWANLEPLLYETDLRPYIFVSQESRTLSDVENQYRDELINKLCSSELGAKQAGKELKNLEEVELDQIFDIILNRIQIDSSLSKKPSEIFGIIEFCKLSIHFQKLTVNFLESLPLDLLGTWVVVGWKEIFTESEIRNDFDLLLEKWSTQNDNKILATSAKLVKE